MYVCLCVYACMYVMNMMFVGLRERERDMYATLSCMYGDVCDERGFLFWERERENVCHP